MSSFQRISALFALIALLFVPLVAAHAQVYSGSYYPTTNYNTSYYPTTSYPTSNQYYNNNNSYYPTNTYGNYGNGYYPYSYPSPTCTLSITSPATYASSQGTVSWTTMNATSVYLSNVGQEAPVGSVSVYMYPGEAFTLTMSGPGGSASCQNTYYPAQQYGYNNGYGYNNQQYYTNQYQSSYYPTYSNPTYYPTTSYPTYSAPVYTQPVNNYNPISYMTNWWNNMMHW